MKKKHLAVLLSVAIAASSASPGFASVPSGTEQSESSDEGDGNTGGSEDEKPGSGTEDEETGDGSGSEDNDSEGDGSEENGSEDSSSDDSGEGGDSKDDGSKDDSSEDDSSKDDGSKDDGSKDNDSEDSSSEDNNSGDDGSEDSGSNDGSSEDDSSNDDGSEDNGSEADSSEDNGIEDGSPNDNSSESDGSGNAISENDGSEDNGSNNDSSSNDGSEDDDSSSDSSNDDGSGDNVQSDAINESDKESNTGLEEEKPDNMLSSSTSVTASTENIPEDVSQDSQAAKDLESLIQSLPTEDEFQEKLDSFGEDEAKEAKSYLESIKKKVEKAAQARDALTAEELDLVDAELLDLLETWEATVDSFEEMELFAMDAESVKSNLESGGIVTLSDDVEFTETITIPEDVETVLDLNGSNVTFTNIAVLGDLTIQGKGTMATETASSAIQVGTYLSSGMSRGSSLTFSDATLDAGGYAISVFGENTKVTVDSGSISADYYVISGNGMATRTSGSVITINGGTLTSREDVAIYHPQRSGSKLVITGGTIEGVWAGIQMCSGSLTVSGDDTLIKATSKTEFPDKDDEAADGSIEDGAAISLLSRSSYGGDISVDISGGTFEAVHYPIKYYGVNTSATSNEQVILDYSIPSGVKSFSISGGTFTGGDGVIWDGYLASSETDDSVEEKNFLSAKGGITGGIFSHDVSVFAAEGFCCILDEDRNYIVEKQEAVASISGTPYYTLEEAFANADNDATVTLLNDVSNVQKIQLNGGKAITLDLNGYDVGFANRQCFEIQDGKLDITGEGTVKEEDPYLGPVMLYGTTENVHDYSVLVVGEDVTLEGWAPVFIDYVDGADKADSGHGIVADIYGTLNSVEDTDGAGGHGVYIQGSLTSTEGAVPAIYIRDNAVITSKGNGMYLAGYAETTVSGNASITGDEAGIEIRAGKLTVQDEAAVTATSSPSESNPNGNGSTTSGAAIAIAQHTTKLPLEVTIEGGVIKGYTPVYQSNPQENDADSVAKVGLSISGGEFIATGESSIYSENLTGFISGGLYNMKPDDSYLMKQPQRYICNLNNDGKYEVFADGSASFSLLRDGEAVQDGTTITLDAGSSETAALSVDDILYAPYSWSISDESVAELSSPEGTEITVTAMKAGTAQIKVNTPYTPNMNGQDYITLNLIVIDSSINAESDVAAPTVSVSVDSDSVAIPAVEGASEEQQVQLESDKNNLIGQLPADLEGNTAVTSQPVETSGNVVSAMMEDGNLNDGQKAVISTDQTLKGVTLDTEVTYTTDENGNQVVESITPYISSVTYSVEAVYELQDLEGNIIQENQPFNLKKRFSITFRIPVPSSVDMRYANVIHKSGEGYADESFQAAIQEENGAKYIEITTNHFSDFILTFTNTKQIDTTYRSSGSSGSDRNIVTKPSGTWETYGNQWKYKFNDGSYATGGWYQLLWNNQNLWYHFDANSIMQTGWFTDTDGRIYYLYPVADGNRGYMMTGWQFIDGIWYYFNTVSDGTKGSMFVNTTTPDGYQVGADGAWIQ